MPASPQVCLVSRVLGLGGSSSRMIRRISSKAAVATPKSITLTTGTPSCGAMRMLFGLRSRCRPARSARDRRLANVDRISKKEKNVVWALLRRKIRLNGPLKLLVAFGKCFP